MLVGNLLCHLQDRLAVKNLIHFSGPFSPDNPLSVDKEEIPLRSGRIPLSVQAPIDLDYFKVRKIA